MEEAGDMPSDPLTVSRGLLVFVRFISFSCSRSACASFYKRQPQCFTWCFGVAGGEGLKRLARVSKAIGLIMSRCTELFFSFA